MINLLDLQASGLAAIQGQGDQDAVVDGRTRPASWTQVLEVLESRQKGSRGGGGLDEGGGSSLTFTAAVLALRRLRPGGQVLLMASTAERRSVSDASETSLFVTFPPALNVFTV